MAVRSRLLDELKQKRPFRSRADEALVSLLRTTDVVRRYVARQLESSDVTPQQYNVLRILRGAGKDGIPTLDIVERMIEQTPGITRLLDRLEAKRLVRRERCAHDRRQVLCWITGPGLALLAGLDEPVEQAAQDLFVKLSAADVESLDEMLAKLRDAAEP